MVYSLIIGTLPRSYLYCVGCGWQESSLALLQQCQTPEELSTVEVQVRGAMKAWSNAAADGPAKPTGAASAASRRGSLDLSSRQGSGGALKDGITALEGASGGREFNWQGVCDWVLGRQLDLWYVLLKAIIPWTRWHQHDPHAVPPTRTLIHICLCQG